ncbi:DUF4215 domain-containing protein [Hyalangium sp.]|uniref:DUF4215 domain-containing protein n=1 Tax=Hyalangium sp. TaxID=2028555 RepID=UPI002D547E94|nr:DUF4215 domain-containing protein [Hyalangium sp.]HYI02301.1 DUF4215 domain-containing protein [Hyalangium sp.]
MSLPLFSCLKLESTACPSGLTCPTGMICAANQDICIEESPSCGDDIEQASMGETCDDGNVEDGDGCSANCESNEKCGNGVEDKHEICDDGNTFSGDGCNEKCSSLEECGNRIIDSDVGEVCDEGDTVGGDGCSADCSSLEECGNHIVDYDAGEICDKGPDVEGDGCGPDCRSGEGCGDGLHGPGEQCDDGNDKDDDACRYADGKCLMARCGDGITKTLEPAEECDDRGESPNCDHDCTRPRCGDGIVNMRAGEQCDPGPRDAATPACTRECQISRCGDGVTNEAAGEECDDGDRNGTGGCLSTCKRNYCGNGTVERDREVCDDGNNQACGRCNATCSQSQFTKATGLITVPSASAINDTESFSLSDGINLPIVFEFEKWGGVTAPHIPIYITGNPPLSAEQIAAAIEWAINHPGRFNLNIKATRNSASVNLIHNDPGAFGNQLIIHDVARPLEVTGMSGGSGKDCPMDVGCRGNDDCARGLTCQGGVCQ